MMAKVAIDFGTTNTLVAIRDDATGDARTVTLPGLSLASDQSPIPLIPSRLMILPDGAIRAGAEALLPAEGGEIFTSFKRGLGSATQAYPREIAGEPWDDSKAAETFLARVVAAIPGTIGEAIDELVLTAPVASFEGYLKWLRDHIRAITPGISKVRVIDECTAAALGYDYREAGELVMVFDFGGGTLDISLVRMPTAGESGGLLIGKGAAEIPAHAVEARVIAKSGRLVGGEDIDAAVLAVVAEKLPDGGRLAGLATDSLMRLAEQTKIKLSGTDRADAMIAGAEDTPDLPMSISRGELEEMLDRRGLFDLIRRTIEQLLRAARQVGIFPEDIKAVLMTGGSSLVPSVRHLLRAYFDRSVIHSHSPFEAVAHGALALAGGLGVSDLIFHAYAVRLYDPLTGGHGWEEIVPAGTRYPMDDPVTLVLAASREKQSAIELVIGEVEEDASTLTEVIIGGKQLRMVAAESMRRIIALNEGEGARTLAFLDPVGSPGADRLEVSFTIDSDRFLRVTITDLMTRRILVNRQKVIELR